MTEFRTHTIESAPDASRDALRGVSERMGFVPNLYATFAESPALLEGYLALAGIFDRSTSFSATERQVILLTASSENECHYCMAAHTAIAGMQRVPLEIVEALRRGEVLPDARLQALSEFAREVVQQRGRVPEAEIDAFLAAGFTRAQVLEVVLGIGLKTLSNYTNHMADTPLDAAFGRHAWVPSPGPAAAL